MCGWGGRVLLNMTFSKVIIIQLISIFWQIVYQKMILFEILHNFVVSDKSEWKKVQAFGEK